MVRHDPELLLVGTSAELAAESGTSKATVSRLVRSLGFQDAAEVRQNLMSARGSGLPWVAEDAAHVDQRAVEARNLDAAFASLGRADRPRLARRIVRARRVLVLGERGAYPIALQLRSQLAQVRSDVRVGPSPGQRLGEEVADLDRHDLVVLVTVRRHTAGVETDRPALRRLRRGRRRARRPDGRGHRRSRHHRDPLPGRLTVGVRLDGRAVRRRRGDHERRLRRLGSRWPGAGRRRRHRLRRPGELAAP
ncbi:hypothetical protein Q9Q99_07495 [Curtobacterium flaccumfaciens]|nr:hypothetical protein Q9Q99_07495 [Curtobacterium flaccumfaciens]